MHTLLFNCILLYFSRCLVCNTYSFLNNLRILTETIFGKRRHLWQSGNWYILHDHDISPSCSYRCNIYYDLIRKTLQETDIKYGSIISHIFCISLFSAFGSVY